MTDKPTISELRSDEQKLRLAITVALEPGPWAHAIIHYGTSCHNLKCLKCKRLWGFAADCPVPDPFIGPLEVAAERLVKKCQPEAVRDAVLAMGDIVRPDVGIDEPEWLLWWVFEATPAERIACCLKALGEVA